MLCFYVTNNVILGEPVFPQQSWMICSELLQISECKTVRTSTLSLSYSDGAQHQEDESQLGAGGTHGTVCLANVTRQAPPWFPSLGHKVSFWMLQYCSFKCTLMGKTPNWTVTGDKRKCSRGDECILPAHPGGYTHPASAIKELPGHLFLRTNKTRVIYLL